MKTNNRKLWLIKIGFASNIYLFAMQGEVEKSMQGTPIILSLFKKIGGGKIFVPSTNRHTQLSFHPN